MELRLIIDIFKTVYGAKNINDFFTNDKEIICTFKRKVEEISKKSLWFNQRMFLKKSIKTGSRAFESARDLSSSGESDFFSTIISGCAFIKTLL